MPKTYITPYFLAIFEGILGSLDKKKDRNMLKSAQNYWKSLKISWLLCHFQKQNIPNDYEWIKITFNPVLTQGYIFFSQLSPCIVIWDVLLLEVTKELIFNDFSKFRSFFSSRERKNASKMAINYGIMKVLAN